MLSNDTDSNSNGFIHKSHKSIASSSADESSDINEFISVNPNDSTTENNTNLSYNSYANHSEPTMRSVVPIPFLQNVKVKHATPKQSNLPKSANHFTKISWKNLKKLFEGKQKVEDLSPQIDYNVKTTLISNENYGNLSTPVAAEPKLETQILLYNGKLETKLDLQNYSTKKSIKQRETRTDYPDASTNLLRTLNKRPDTLPLTKSIDISYLSFEQKMNTRKMKKILKNNEKTNFSQDLLESEKLYSQNRNSLAKSLTNSSTISSDDAELKTLRLPLEVEECTECQKCMKVVDSKKLVVESFLEQDIVKGIAEKPNLHYCNKFVLNTNLHCQGARMNKDLSLRVKTTEDVNLVTCKRNSIARFSLYDDRIMSGTCNDEKSKNELEPDHYLKLCNSFENIKFTDSV